MRDRGLWDHHTPLHGSPRAIRRGWHRPLAESWFLLAGTHEGAHCRFADSKGASNTHTFGRGAQLPARTHALSPPLLYAATCYAPSTR